MDHARSVRICAGVLEQASQPYTGRSRPLADNTREPRLRPASGSVTPGESRVSARAATRGESAALSDAQIAAIATAANDAEIEQAKLAQNRAQDPRVRDFATATLQRHQRAKRDQAGIEARLGLTPKRSPTYGRMTSTGRSGSTSACSAGWTRN